MKLLTRSRRNEAQAPARPRGQRGDKLADWHGQSGKAYEYWVYPADARFNEHRPANYIFARRDDAGDWTALFVGQCGDLAMPLLQGHYQERAIEAAGATHVHIHYASIDLPRRLAEEEDLRQRHNPPCNRL